MGNLTSVVGSALEKFGKSFLVVGYVPALLFIVVHQLFLFPLWIGGSLNLFAPQSLAGVAPSGTDVGVISSGLTTLVLPLIIGILLLAFGSTTIKLYEGRIGFLQKSLLRYFQNRNIRTAHDLYGNLLEYKKAYRGTLLELDKADSPNKRTEAQAKLDSLALQIQEQYERLEQHTPTQSLPMREFRVTPTALGNTFAVIEEYPYDRYSIDSVLYWPRLRPLLDEAAPNQAELLTNQKTVLDMTLNFSLLSGIAAVEFILTLIFKARDRGGELLLFAIVSAALFWVFYRAAVSAAQTFGN